MYILALETSTPQGSLALWRQGEILFQQEFVTERAHNAALFAPLASALELIPKEEQEVYVVVGQGPGTYTGVRIAIAAAQGVALAKNWRVLGLPVGACMEKIGMDSGWIVGNARRGEYFLQSCNQGRLGEPFFDELEEVLAKIPSGEVACSCEFTWREDSPHGVLWQQPSAAILCASAALLTVEELQSRSKEGLEPAYIRAPFITLPKSARVPS